MAQDKAEAENAALAALDPEEEAALAAEQAEAEAAAAKHREANRKGAKGGAQSQANGQAAFEEALAALPLYVWFFVGGGLAVVVGAATYTAYRLGRNKQAISKVSKK